MADTPPIPPVTEEPTVTISRELLESLLDPDDCWFDHHGGCQAHGYLSLDQGEMCPVEEAKRLLASSQTADSAQEKS